MQRERTPEEKAMPEWMRNYQDRMHSEFETNRLMNPAICEQLSRIEAKLDEILGILQVTNQKTTR